MKLFQGGFGAIFGVIWVYGEFLGYFAAFFLLLDKNLPCGCSAVGCKGMEINCFWQSLCRAWVAQPRVAVCGSSTEQCSAPCQAAPAALQALSELAAPCSSCRAALFG